MRAIEQRAEALNLTPHELCAEAKVPHSTFWRMQQPDANPKVKTIERILGCLEAHLDKKEAALRRALARQASRPAA